MSGSLDEDFDGFLQDMGPPIDRVYVPKSSMERFRGRLPNQLLKYWDEHGWCGYADGLFWTVDPHDYEPALEAWIGNTPFMEADAYHVIARSAFGNMYLWGERTGFTLLICALGGFAVPHAPPIASLDQEIQWFFGLRDKEEHDFAEFFSPALTKLGRLNHDEMYGFNPALALGGASELENLQKVKAVEHLVFLAQLSDLHVISKAPR